MFRIFTALLMTLTMVAVLLICVMFPWLALALVGGAGWTWW